ncbi:MAG: gliding motility-associated C-terminal domain-containing protein [Chitinophagales bacterium]
MTGTGCKKYLIFVLFIFSNCFTSAQSYQIRWQYSWGGNREDALSTMIPVSGNKFFYAGYAASDPSCNKSDINYGDVDMVAMLMDDAGNKLWDRSYGGDKHDMAFSAIRVSSGGYILAGRTESGPSGIKNSPLIGAGDMWVVRIDDNGNMLWERTYGTIGFDVAQKILETPDGGFLLGGTYSPASVGPVAGFGWGDYELRKIDANGNSLWARFFGGTESEQFADLIPSDDGNYFLSGTSSSPPGGNKSSPLIGVEDIWLLKVDPAGVKIWDKTFGTTERDYFGTLTALSDGNFLIVDAAPSATRIRKVDGNGGQIWMRTCANNNEEIFLIATEDVATGNLYVAGMGRAPGNGCKTSPWHGGGSFGDIWLCIYDSAGNKMDDMDFGGSDVDEPTDIDVVNDEIWITAWSDSQLGGNKTTNNCGQTADGWIIRLARNFYINTKTPTALCNSQGSMKVHFTTIADFNPGNTFTVQLSDANGSFAQPFIIGTLNGLRSDSVVVTLPPGLPTSSNYKIRVIGSLPADTTTSYAFWLYGAPLVNLGNDTTICERTNLSLRAGVQPPASQIVWNTGNNNSSIVVTDPGTYWCEVQSPGCGIDRDSINVQVKLIPITNIGPDTSFCAGKTVVLGANPQLPDVTYLWNTGIGNNSLAIQDGGIYWLRITNGCGSSTDSLSATKNPLPVISFDKSDFLCEGTSRILHAGNGYSIYSWNNGATTPDISVNNVGTYSVIVTDNNGCNGSDTSRINQIIQLPSKFLPGDTTICPYEDILLKPNKNFSDYLWNTGAISNSILVKQTDAYWLQVKDSYGCTGKDTIIVTPKECPTGFYMPTAFTPNSDGKNDVCKPSVFGNVIQFHFTLYNRWGEKVYESKDRNSGWDGTFKGLPAGTAVFVWTCTFQIMGDAPRLEKGTVVLIR